MKRNHSPVTIIGSHTRSLPTMFVDESSYELLVWLPPNYETSEEKYPVLYVLDAPLIFASAVENFIFSQYDSDVVPDMIIIGISKKMETTEEWWYARWRDYSPVPLPSIEGSGHAEDYLKFLEQECIPFVDENYRTQPDDRIIWGGSMGGLLAIYILFNLTHLFNRYIVNAPAFVFQNTTVFDFEAAIASASLSSPVRLFASVGALDENYKKQLKAFTTALTERNLPNLKFQALVLEGLDHANAAIPAFSYGIQAVYKK